jgi:hypothetical protein
VRPILSYWQMGVSLVPLRQINGGCSVQKKTVTLPKGLDEFLGETEVPLPNEESPKLPDTTEPRFLTDDEIAVAAKAAQLIRREFGITSSSWAWQAQVPQTVIDRLLSSGMRRVNEEHLQNVVAALTLEMPEFLALADKSELSPEERNKYWNKIKQNIGEWNLRTYAMGKRRAWR